MSPAFLGSAFSEPFPFPLSFAAVPAAPTPADALKKSFGSITLPLGFSVGAEAMVSVAFRPATLLTPSALERLPKGDCCSSTSGGVGAAGGGTSSTEGHRTPLNL